MREEELIKALKEMDKKRVEELDKNTKKVFDAVMKIADDKDKYKSLYQNEKDHTDTLKRIIKKIEEYIEENNLFCYKYDEEELFEIITDKEAKKYLLDLLKEVK